MIRGLSPTSVMKSVLVILIAFSLVIQSIVGVTSPAPTLNSNQNIVSKLSRDIELSPGLDYYIKFDAKSLKLNAQSKEPATNGLSSQVIAAIVKSPRWIQQRLTSQFHTLRNPGSYADVLLNASKQITDEIAFSIACCPTGRVPSASILKENVESLYEHDAWIHYADIVDDDDGTGNYSSTLRYRILENGIETYLKLPPEIYYWYVVHPKITTEDIDAEYGALWRNYLFEHNDQGYPLLKEKLAAIQYLWDGDSYTQPAYRLWTECITEHPTAIEAVSYWIGKTVPYPAMGDRPGQSCIVAHEHNGWCGELQKIAIAAQRSALIPTIGASNVGEDHVWREFYERGWHENDNWWSDTGGAVDQPDVYAYGWGKSMSAIYQWKGDGTILQDTAYYIHPDDRITVSFVIKDLLLQAVDGVRIIVLVKGLKDITYYTNLFWERIQVFWDTLPDIVKGPLLTLLFERIQERFDQLPESVNGVTISTWSYTDAQGRCSLELGKNLEYLFLIQEGNLKKPWQLARHNILRSLSTHTDKEFTIILSDVSHPPLKRIEQEMPSGDCLFTFSLTSSAYQLQTHFINDGIGRHITQGAVECFFVDQENFERYKDGVIFTCYHYLETNTAMISTSAPMQNWYLVLRNPTRETYVDISVLVDVTVQTTSEHIQIVTPATTLFDIPIFTLGDIVPLTGITTADQLTLTVDQQPPAIPLTVVDGCWSYLWNTMGQSTGFHQITVTTPQGISDEQNIRLLDGLPPSIKIESPVDGTILKNGYLTISGQSEDNYAIDRIDITLDNQTRKATGTTNWNLTWDTTGLPLGDHHLTVTAVDTHGLIATQICSVVLNDTGHTWGPQINTCTHEPIHPTNTSNLVIYTNVTTTGPFAIASVILYYTNGTTTTSQEMFRYAQYPVQSRHEEDPLRNQTNDPVFGIELGQFPTGTTITYWTVARDTAHNTRQSTIASVNIE